MKKTLQYKILIAAMALLAMLCVCAVCSASQLAGGTYENLTWTIDNDTGVNRLTITGSGEMKTAAGDTFFPWSTWGSVQKVVIGYGITNVGENAFVSFRKIEEVDLPGSIKSIDSGAFHYCERLSSITLPTGIRTIGSFAFCGCKSLSSILNIQYVTSIGDCAFADCESLTSFTISRSVTSLGDDVFLSCTGLQTVTIQTLASEINFPELFPFCSNLMTVIIPEDNPYYCSEYGVVFNKEKTTILFYPQGQSGPYEIPYSVTTIGEGTFTRCSKLSDVTIHINVTSIEDYAFCFCTGLARVKIPDSVTNMGRGVFYECSNLLDIHMPKHLSNIAQELFFGCSSLESIVIPDTAAFIDERAFQNCTSLETVTIPSGVKSIGNYAFGHCDQLKDIYFLGTQDEWNSITVGNNNEALSNARITFAGTTVIIDSTNFPDDTFRAIVSEFDTNHDGEFSIREIANVTELYCEWKNIQSAKGIEYFPYLTTLSFRINQLKELDVSNNTALTWLDCRVNQLTELNIGNNRQLATLYCDNNFIKYIDVSSCSRLDNLVKTTERNISGVGYDTFNNGTDFFDLDTSVTVFASGDYVSDGYSYNEVFVLPKKTQTIESQAFAGTSDLMVYIPETVTYIAADAFEPTTTVTCPAGSYVETRCRELGLTVRLQP